MRLLVSLVFLPFSLFAQVNSPLDRCDQARVLTNLDNWCSDSAAFSTVGALDEGLLPATCFPQETQRDVWFSFTARGTHVSIEVIGDTRLGKGGSLRSPQLAIYRGACNQLVQVACTSDNLIPANNAVQIISSAMVLGQRYVVRVSARGGNTGTFRLCINSFTSAGASSGDCSTAVILCNQDPQTVVSVRDRGVTLDNINDVFCVNNLGQRAPVVEEQSTWYKWTVQTAGTFTFTLTPGNPSDDLDWALYELSTLNNCNNKRMLRYSIVGENVGEPLNRWIACTGPTGIREGETDETESCGCNAGANSFVRPVNLEAGKSYALVVMNFSQSGFGYDLSFGGTSRFRGPTVNFSADQTEACVGSPIQFRDESGTSTTINAWNWTFPPAARITNFSGKGPHTVVFDQPGTMPVLLRVTSTEGCSSSKVVDVRITCCKDHFQTTTTTSDISCPGTLTGKIGLSITNDYAPYNYSWSDGGTSGSRTGLAPGNYTVTVSDRSTCAASYGFSLSSPREISMEPLLRMPRCDGGRDGSIRLRVSGATSPYQYSWNGAAFQDLNVVEGLPVGSYRVSVRDANKCLFDTLVNLMELMLELDPGLESVTRPRCLGFKDGKIEVKMDNGLSPYEFDWKDGRGFQSANTLLNLGAGTYSLRVRDSNRCLGDFTFTMADYPKLAVNLSQTPISCYGMRDGSVQANGVGGNGNYVYRWSQGARDPIIRDLAPGRYGLTLFDRNGCKLDTFVLLPEPPPLEIGSLKITDNACFGTQKGAISVIGAGGTPPYTYGIESNPLQTRNLFGNLAAGTYSVRVTDVLGCTVEEKAIVRHPDKLLVNAGRDTIVNLGTYLQLSALVNRNLVNYSWIPSGLVVCATCAVTRTKERIINPMVFKVVVTDPDGCQAEDEVAVEVARNRPVFIPSAFSPNSDGQNDFFTAFANESALSIKSLQIYDRYGGIIYAVENIAVNDESSGWDGKDGHGLPLNAGVYLYTFTIGFIDGQDLTLSGIVNLMR